MYVLSNERVKLISLPMVRLLQLVWKECRSHLGSKSLWFNVEKLETSLPTLFSHPLPSLLFYLSLWSAS